MRDTTSRLDAMLAGSRQITWEATIVRDDQALTVPVLLGGSPTWSAAQQVELSAKIRVPLNPADGVSRAPTEPGDLFAPFGSEVLLVCAISIGVDDVERVQVGRLRIHKVPAVQAERLQVLGEWRTFSEVIDLELRDRMDVLNRDEFDAPTAVRHPGSAWAELDALSPFPVVRDGDDVTLPTNLTYEGTRADAVQAVAQRLGGVAAFDPFGNLTVRRPGTAPVLTLDLGPSGTVADVGSVMDSEGVYNRVRVVGKAPDGTPIVAIRELQGDLAPARWGRRTYTADQGELLSNRANAEDYAGRLLARVSTVGASELEVQCLLDPRLELDDVAEVHHHGITQRIRATKITYGDTLMTVTGDVV